MSKQILLTQGKVAIVDDGDYRYLNQWKWLAAKQGNTWYAHRAIRIDGKQQILSMHRLLMPTTGEALIDHIDRDGLNNQRSNLREATVSQNQMNSVSHANSSSKYKGVSWHKRRKAWQVNVLRKSYGYFDSEVEAALEYNKVAPILFGEFARLNIVKEE